MLSRQPKPNPTALDYARSVVNPCDSPAQHITDDYHGACIVAKTCTVFSFTANSSGDAGVCVMPGNGDAIKAADTTTWGTINDTDDARTTELQALFTYFRVTAMCVKFEFIGAADDAAGMISVVHVPAWTDLFGANASAMEANLLKTGQVESSMGKRSFEHTWRPKSAADLVPLVPTANFDSDNDIEGRLLSYRGGIYAVLRGAKTSAAVWRITVTRCIEGFFLPGYQFLSEYLVNNDPVSLAQALNAVNSVPTGTPTKAAESQVKNKLAAAAKYAFGAWARTIQAGGVGGIKAALDGRSPLDGAINAQKKALLQETKKAVQKLEKKNKKK